jgi:hypothetical protein
VTSAALDAAFCLLLVSAGVGTLVAVDGPETAAGEGGTTRADATAERLATATATVNYSLATGLRERGTTDRFPRLGGPRFRRTDHGSFARLLAGAAVANATVGGRPVSDAAVGFVRAVRAAVANATGPRVRVVARWRPYPGSPIRGRVAVGGAPPRTADVHAATLTVPVRSEPGATDADGPERDPVRRTADEVARRTVGAVVPAERSRAGLRADYPASALVEHRYRRLADGLGVSVGPALNRDRPEVANRRLVGALRPRIERDLRERYRDREPRAAARATAADRVRIVVRTWSP